jgi:antibiotic biosynthesis monooxygenase (ABM) superfamily enzyme
MSTDSTQTAPVATASTMPAPPSVHVRALITWVAIFPLVALGMVALAPIFEPLHPVLRALILTAIVVPLAVYVVVPRLMAVHRRIAGRRRR